MDITPCGRETPIHVAASSDLSIRYVVVFVFFFDRKQEVLHKPGGSTPPNCFWFDLWMFGFLVLDLFSVKNDLPSPLPPPLPLWVWILDRLSFDDFEVEEEVRPDFPCPYCYEDYDIASLCSHLEDEHPFESKVTVS
uniref:Di19 zinc-binding domain-containing protein n=1 Tax=Nelumbo nucifera TaxID=4432 RepID=A0A822XQ35_NELNU|nr:TPA_asm: hypothetical protein HUJ06_022509 [Nelumbo nucifera]